MLEQLIKQLQHSDPKQRIEVIKSIAKLGDPRALKPLRYICENDPDPEVRELALKAGKHIRKQTRNQASQPVSPPKPQPSLQDNLSDDSASWGPNPYMPQLQFDSPATPPPDLPPEVEVSKRDIDRGRTYLDRAAQFRLKNRIDLVIENLALALRHNPNLRRDSLALGLASQVTGLRGQAAVNALLDDEQRKILQKRARKYRSRQGKSSGGSWADMPIWGWLFMAACITIPVISLGGAIPGAIGVGGAASCASVARDDSKDPVTRMILCAGITIFAWAIFIGLVAVILGSGVAG